MKNKIFCQLLSQKPDEMRESNVRWNNIRPRGMATHFRGLGKGQKVYPLGVKLTNFNL